MRTVLTGTEELSLEIDGTIPEGAARAVVGPGVELSSHDGRVAVSLLVFAMKGLVLRRLPVRALGLDYNEALWRVGARVRGEPAWFGASCDLDSAVVASLGRLLVRYPVRRARVSLAADAGEASARIEVAGARLALDARVTAEPSEIVPPRPVLVRSGGDLYEVPWDEVPAPERATVEVTADDALSAATLGAAVAWSGAGVLHRGRTHRCGFAARPRR